jgi:hexosaminidase
MIALVPEPREIELLEGTLDLRRGVAVLAPGPFEGAGAVAAAWAAQALGLRGSDASVALERQGSRDIGGKAEIAFSLDEGLGPEDYRLEILPGRAAITASTNEGAVMGASTLRQLILSEGPLIPSLRIGDGPRFAWRGVHLDCARNFFRVEFIERLLDLAALHKLNRFHWHLTDDQAWRLEIPSHPELAEFGSKRRDARHSYERYHEGSYSRSDAQRVVAYAKARGIVVVPEIETPGHALALLASHPELSCRGSAEGGAPFLPEDRYGIFEDILCAGNDAVFELLGDIYDEVASVFPGAWVHAGGDEAPKARWKSCPKCAARMEAEGLRGGGPDARAELLQGWFMDRVAALLSDRGKRMVGWDEILDGHVRKDALIMSWRGSAGGIAAAKAGYEAVMCPQTKACYLDHKHLDLAEEPGNIGVCTVYDSYSFDPVPPGLDGSEAARILGGQANLWSEFMYFGRQVEYMAFPRLCALSEVFWSPREKRDFASFERRMEKHGKTLDLLGVNRFRGALRG